MVADKKLPRVVMDKLEFYDWKADISRDAVAGSWVRNGVVLTIHPTGRGSKDFHVAIRVAQGVSVRLVSLEVLLVFIERVGE